MCLWEVKEHCTNVDKDEVHTGYKWLERVDERTYRSPCMRQNIYLEREWYPAEHYKCYVEKPVEYRTKTESKSYTSGFHIFRTIEEARKHWLGDIKVSAPMPELCLVSYRNPTTIGTERDSYGIQTQVVVADEMCVIGEVK